MMEAANSVHNVSASANENANSANENTSPVRETDKNTSPVREDMLRIQGLVFDYGEAGVLAGIDLAVQRGSCMCLMGQNGCGKSTLINCVLGDNKPSAGSIEIEGQDALAMKAPQLARLASYVPQVHNRTFPYEVAHVVLMGRAPYLGATGVATAQDYKLVEEALENCGIAHLAQRSYTTLSGGEMQMVLLARALVQQAPLVLMDEPTAHLDLKNELRFLEAVEQLVLETGTTVLMATHAPNQAFYLQAAGCPVRVAVMHEGVVATQGRAENVLTPETMDAYFGVQAAVAEVEVDGTAIRQIVPCASTKQSTRQRDYSFALFERE